MQQASAEKDTNWGLYLNLLSLVCTLVEGFGLIDPFGVYVDGLVEGVNSHIEMGCTLAALQRTYLSFLVHFHLNGVGV